MKLTLLFAIIIIPFNLMSQLYAPLETTSTQKQSSNTVRTMHYGLTAKMNFGKWGFVDAKGKTKISFIYDIVSDFHEGSAVVKLDKWFQIDTLGVIVKEVTERYAHRFLPPLLVSSNSTTNKFKDQASRLLTQNIIQTTLTGQCPPNIDFEMGNFTNWYCYTGRVSKNSQGNNVITYYNNNPPQNTPVNGRHGIIQRTPTPALDFYGRFPLNAPDGSGNVVKLGNDFVLDSAEKIRYIIQVPPNANDYSITFQYAVVLENPNNGIAHTPDEKPRMLAQLIDAANGNIIQCADFLYVAAGSITGFFDSPVDPNVKCKSWTPVFVNLSPYAGRTLYLDFVTADCTLGGHFGYAYIDVGPCNQAISVQRQCNPPNITTLYGPPSFQRYNWWDNNFTTLLGTSQNLILNPGPPINTIYKLEVIPDNGVGCKDTLITQITQNYPVANAGPDKTSCSLANVTIGSPPIAGYTYQWTPQSYLNNAQISNPVSSTPVPITYILTVTDANGCSKQDTMNILLNPKPISGFTVNTTSQCLGNNVFSFVNNSSLTTGTFSNFWDFGDASYSTSANPSHTYSSPGNYNVKLVVTSNIGCSDRVVVPVTVYAKPVINYSINTSNQCLAGNNFIFTNNSPLSNGSIVFLWDFGDGIISTSNNATHSYLTPGNYPVKLIGTTNNGCKDSLTKVIRVNANPNISLNANRNLTLCRNNSAQLIANGALSYQWTPINGLSCNSCPNPIATPLTNTTYIVKGVDINGCPGYDTLAVTVMQPIRITSLGDSICTGDTTRLLVSGASNYVWSPSAGLSNTNIPTPLAYPVTNTIYRVVGYDGVNCFTDTNYVKITVGPKLSISLGNDLSLSTGTVFNFNPVIINGPVTTWLWTPSIELNCTTCPSPTATAKNNIRYSVFVKDMFGCTASDDITITTFCKNSQIFIPNAFTPDGNGVNDILMIRAKGVIRINHFRIFNRWGELLFEKNYFPPNNPQYGWDGKIRGVIGQPDVFVYTAEAVCENGTSFIYKGNFSIIR